MFNEMQGIMNKSNTTPHSLNRDNFKDLCPFLLYNIELKHCKIADEKVRLSGWQGKIF